MPRWLSKIDSFNSSNSTVVPDSDLRSTSNTASTSNTTSTTNSNNNVAQLNSARVLMPQDTLGRELDAVMQDSQGQSDELVNALRDFQSQHAPEHQSQSNLEAFLHQSHPDFAALLTSPNPSTNATDVLAKLQKDHLASRRAQPTFDPFRPSSAHSHRSSVSGGSDYSYATTEMDADEAERLRGDTVAPRGRVEGIAPGAMNTGMSWDIQEMAVDQNYPTPGASAGEYSPPNQTVNGKLTGNVKGVGMDDETARQKRLEHRRQINRKSAQKHRLRRKEEVELLANTIIEKDAKIAQLEKDLAVERSRVAQLQDFVDMQKGKDRGERMGRHRW